MLIGMGFRLGVQSTSLLYGDSGPHPTCKVRARRANGNKRKHVSGHLSMGFSIYPIQRYVKSSSHSIYNIAQPQLTILQLR